MDARNRPAALPTTREQFVEYQNRRLDELFSFTDGEEESRHNLEALSLETYDFLVGHGVRAAFVYIEPTYAQRILSYDKPRLPEPLRRRWEKWSAEYDLILARNPQLELMRAMKMISESHDASSWPNGYERRIQAWVDAHNPTAPPPFDDRYGVVTPEFYKRLEELRQTCGGWVYWDDSVDHIVFAPETEWQQVRTAQEAAEAERRRRWEESKARSERQAARLMEVMTIARADDAFWSALRSWELNREAQRPTEPTSVAKSEFSGRATVIQLSTAQQKARDDPPVAPIFAEFIARIGGADDVLSARDIVLNLRSEMRRGLGLDHTIGWKNGPDIGMA